MIKTSSYSRRDFIRFTGITGTGFLIGLNSSCTNAPKVANLSEAKEFFELTPYISIADNGIITIFNTKPEIGQGVWQSIPALVCEELEVPIESVVIKQTGGEKKYGDMQFAGGSFSVRSSYHDLRKVGAAAKEMLIAAAAKKWNVPASECHAENAEVIHQSGKKLSYGELASAAAKMPVPEKPTLKDPKNFKILGKPSPRPDIPLKVNGTATFGIDATVDNMVFASVEHGPVFGAKLLSIDDTDAKKIPGVIAVEKCTRIIQKYRYDAVAVVASNYWTAIQARKALKLKWDFQGKDSFNTNDYENKLRSLANKNGVSDKTFGDFNKAFASSSQKLEAFYETPMVSHSPLEPMNCLAHWKDDSHLEIWASTQVPGSVKSDFAKEYNIPEDNLTVNVLFSGGGFGRRLYPDHVHEAVQLSKKVGKPVKVLWTREDDTTQGPFRPMTFSAMKGGLSPDGKLIAFQHKVISPSISEADGAFDKTKVDGTMTEAINDQKYEIPNMHNTYVYADLHIPIAAWRAVTSTTLAFAHECFIDEMAHAAGKDPLQFRLDMAKKDSDLHRILNKLKEIADGMEKPMAAGSGIGVAQYEFFAGHSGFLVKVSKKDKGIRIDNVHCVIDMGTVVNPDTIHAQVEGAVAMAITAAIKNGITFENGRTKQSNYHDNPVIRMPEMPPVVVHILADGGEVIKGAGEPGLPPLAPALCNAIFAATGVRIRKLPFDINNIG